MTGESAALVPREDENVVEAVEKFLGTSVSRSAAKKLMVGGIGVAVFGAVMLLKAASDEEERDALRRDNEATVRAQLLEQLGHKRDPRTCQFTYYGLTGGLTGEPAVVCSCGVRKRIPDELPEPE